MYFITQSFFTYLWIPKNNRKKKRKIPPLKNIQCLKYIFLNNHFSQISSREDIPQNQHPSNRPSCCKIQRNLRNFDVPPLFLNNKKKEKKKEKRMADEKKKEIAQETSGKDNKRSLFIETSVATGWHVRFIYDAIEPLPINPSTSRVSCEGGTKAASADRYRADIRTISRRSSRGNLHRGNGKKVQRTSSSGRITIDWRVLDMCALSTETVSSFRRQMFLLRNAIIQ